MELDRERMLSHINQDEDLILGNHILDKVEMVLKRKGTESTNFLNPYQQELSTGLIKQIFDVNYLLDGGYKKAERKRISIFPEYLFPDHVESPVSLLKLQGNFRFQPVSHRDFLGSILGLGIKREMVGDLLILDEFAQVVVANEIKDFIQLKLDRVHQVPVEISEISPDKLVIPQENCKEIRTTVASMRLDAVASAGFGDSRSKIARDIKSDKVKINWKPDNNPAQTVEVNDLISIRGRGRVKIVADEGLSHRGRIKLKLKRFL